MKKPSILLAFAIVGSLISIHSCSKASVLASVITANINGTSYSFPTTLGIYIYQSAGYSAFSATDNNNDMISFNLNNTTSGTYPVGHSYTSALNANVNGNSYSSLNIGSYGMVNLTLGSNSWATGTFSGTLVNNSNASDSIKILNGALSVKYQY